MGGVAEKNLQNKPWDDVEIGWLSILGYEAYLIDPIEDSQWQPAVQLTDGKLSVSESGITDQYTLSWAGNISNQWYVGLNLNIPTLSYTKRTSHYETDRVNSAELRSLYHLSGLGVNGAIGLIYRPIFWSAVMLIAGLLELGMIVPVWILLKTRLKEIEGGEEDAAAQY